MSEFGWTQLLNIFTSIDNALLALSAKEIDTQLNVMELG